jgi:hypothetical protein
MTKNAELAYKTLDHIIAHPEEWNQEAWICDTGMCFAGHATILAGWKPVFKGKLPTGDVCKPNVRTTIMRAAIHELGITRVQTNLLFAGSNTLEHLIERVEDFFGPDPRLKGKTSEERLEEVQMTGLE